MGRSRNVRLTARMEELGLTRQGLADEVNRVIYGWSVTATETRSGTNERWVYRLLAGQTRWPRAEYRHALERVLGCSAVDLGFSPPLTYRGYGRTLEIAVAEDDMDRRRFLVVGLTGSLGVATVTVPDLGDATRVGMSDLDQLRTPLRELRALDQRRGGGNLAPSAAQIADEVGRLLDNAVMSARVRRAAYALQGEYLTDAGWFAIDAGDTDTARAYLERASIVAAMAREPMLQAHIWNTLAWTAGEDSKWGEVLAIAQASMTGAAARREPRVAAQMHGWAAKAYAARGYEGPARRSIGRARDALDKITDTDPPPTWIAFVDHSEIDTQGANAARRLGRFPVAAELAECALHATPADAERNRVGRGLMLARSRLGMGEVEGAVDAADSPLAHMVSIHSGRLLQRLHAVRVELGQWHEVPAARDWIERFDAQASA